MSEVALILGGTKGLGRALAIEAVARGLAPVAVGRDSAAAAADPELTGCLLQRADLSDLDEAAGLVDSLYSEGLLPEGQPLRYVFWVAATFIRRPVLTYSVEDVRRMVNTNLGGPVCAMAAIHRKMVELSHGDPEAETPVHWITIGSTSSWMVREYETLYCAVKSAKAHLTRNFTRELVRDLPGSKVTMVHPGGLKSPNWWKDLEQDTENYMELDVVARLIWDQVAGQSGRYREMLILRGQDGTPKVDWGPQKPEGPFDFNPHV